jgi:hypothetical protein
VVEKPNTTTKHNKERKTAMIKNVIYKENGIYKITTEENYRSPVQNARLIYTLKDFGSAEEIIEYFIANFGDMYSKENFIVINGGFTEGNFLDDEEKMRDFYELTKEEFLFSYSYLTEEEYDNTAKLVKKEKEAEEIMNHYDEGCKKWSKLFAELK